MNHHCCCQCRQRDAGLFVLIVVLPLVVIGLAWRYWQVSIPLVAVTAAMLLARKAREKEDVNG